jgi:hypothetical protein
LTIQVEPVPGGSLARITYMHTSLGAAGDAFVEHFTEPFFRDFMERWEKRMNHYLTHGSMLTEPSS